MAILVGSEAIPVGKMTIPVGIVAIPVGNMAIPAGKVTIPVGKKEIPPGIRLIPAGMEAIPIGNGVNCPIIRKTGRFKSMPCAFTTGIGFTITLSSCLLKKLSKYRRERVMNLSSPINIRRQ